MPIREKSSRSRRIGIEFDSVEEIPMRDFLLGVLFIAIVITPCVVALTMRLDDRGSKYDR